MLICDLPEYRNLNSTRKVYFLVELLSMFFVALLIAAVARKAVGYTAAALKDQVFFAYKNTCSYSSAQIFFF